MARNYTLHDLPIEERPRERLRKVGVDNLSVQELLALVIERGKKGQNVLSIAQNLLAHNHPSGDHQPSEDDLEITKRLVEAGKILGIKVIDHIIVAKNDFLSFKEKDLI